MKPMTVDSKYRAAILISRLESTAYDLKNLQQDQNGLDFMNTLKVANVLRLLTKIVERDRSRLGEAAE